MKKWYKSKSMWFGLVIGVVGAVQTAVEGSTISSNTQGIILAVIGAVTMLLRTLTTTSIGSDGS